MVKLTKSQIANLRHFSKRGFGLSKRMRDRIEARASLRSDVVASLYKAGMIRRTDNWGTEVTSSGVWQTLMTWDGGHR